MLPIVTPAEMKRIEQLAFAAGEDDETYMVNAGNGIASELQSILKTPRDGTEVILLIGKGNNGGDAFVIGRVLLDAGYIVVAFCLHPIKECSPLCQKMGKRFRDKGGHVVGITEMPALPKKAVLIDGLLGTGFEGEVTGLYAEVIDAANDSELSVYAIDIPSGLNGETGMASKSTIKADITFTLGLPKIGFFLKDGWNHIGKFKVIDFGMPIHFVQEANNAALLATKDDVAHLLPPIERSRHKYEAGYVVAIGGSTGMSGAPQMSCLAALKAGAGIIRLFYPPEIESDLASAPYELVREPWDEKDTSRIEQELFRAKACLFGPGMGRTEKSAHAFETLLPKIDVPLVLDADALFHLASHPDTLFPEETVLTPHHGEMKKILGQEPTFDACKNYVKEKKVTLVLKGAPTIVFSRFGEPIVIPRGDPGMATAGSGDVLTGIIAAFLAQGLNAHNAALLSVYLHGLAGELAADSETSYGLIATDIIHLLPDAIRAVVD